MDSKEILKKYMPDTGEGETLASQAVTAVNKLNYKWYNDGDVYDTTNMKGWANDLTSYANWLAKHIDGTEEILDKIYKIEYNDEKAYEGIINELKAFVYNDKLLSELDKKPKEGTIYDCAGSYQFSINDDDDEDDWDDGDGIYDDEDEEDELEESKKDEVNFDKCQAVLQLDNSYEMGIIISPDNKTVQYMYSDGDGPYESEIEYDEDGNPYFRDEEGTIWEIGDFMRTNSEEDELNENCTQVASVPTSKVGVFGANKETEELFEGNNNLNDILTQMTKLKDYE